MKKVFTEQCFESRRAFLRQSAFGCAALPFVSGLPASVRAQENHQRRSAEVPVISPRVHLNVRDFGATGDGKTKDTLALQLALDRCSVLGGGEVLVPAGEYLTGAIALRSNTLLRLDAGASILGSPNLADYPITQVRWEGHWEKGYLGLISALDAENIEIVGAGKIAGNREIKGRVQRESHLRNPALLEFTNCRNVTVEGCDTDQNDMWSIHPTFCENVTFRNLAVHGGADGIDVDSCTNVVIDGCDFVTGDDCISLKSGRGMEGFTIHRPTERVRISNCTFNDAHWACIGIGSETSGGIRDVHIEHCRCVGARTFAIYIKSRPGRGAFIEDIYINDLEVRGAQQGFLRINMLDSGKQDEFPVPGPEGIPTVRNFQFSNIRVNDVPVLVQAVNISPDKPLDGFSLSNVSGTCGKGIFLANIRHADLRGIHVTGYSGSLLNTYDVTGSGLHGAAPLPPPKPAAAVPAPAQPYSLH